MGSVFSISYSVLVMSTGAMCDQDGQVVIIGACEAHLNREDVYRLYTTPPYQ